MNQTRGAVSNYENAHNCQQEDPNNNNKDEKIEVSDEELYLFQVVDEVLFLAVHSSGSIEIIEANTVVHRNRF